MAINFNNAGASSIDQKILKEIFSYLHLERELGGYEAFEIKEKKIDKLYDYISVLINCSPNEVSYFSSATLAWSQIFNSIQFDKKDNIVIFDNEYTSNYISFLKRKNEFSQIRIINIDEFGKINLGQLKNNIDENTKLLHVTHIASQCGNEIPIIKIGNLLKKKNPEAIYFIDACQSIGQKEINVKKCKCDILTGTGRKYLMGPRGTGFSYIRKALRKTLVPSIEDMTSTDIKENSLFLKKNYRFLETFEYSPALKLGLSLSVNKILKIGIKKISSKILELSKYLRFKLKENKRSIFYENEEFLSGINTIDFLGIDNEKIQKFLKKNKIYTYLSTSNVSYLYFKKIKKSNLLRVSFNYYNTKSQIDRFVIKVNEYVK